MVEGPDTTKSDEAVQTKSELPRRKCKEDKLPTKVVIRRLPGTMTEESFLDHISPLFENDYFYFVHDENSTLGEHNYSRAYINFVNIDDVFTFTSKFDDYVFIDSTGQEYPAVVEFAPFQRIPKNRTIRKSDPLCGFIEDDTDYKKFLHQLEFEEQDHKPANQITEHYFDLANDENEEKITTTPLLEFLTSKKNEYVKYKEEKKEERRRRDVERRKLKEESRRIKKELKEAHKVALEKISRIKDDKKKDTECKGLEDANAASSVRVKGKSYQEERQRDLARRKQEEKPFCSGDMKEYKSFTESEKSSPQDRAYKKESSNRNEFPKEECKSDRGDKVDDDSKKKADDKKPYRDDDKRYSYSRDKDEKKSFYGVKKREYANGYEYDSKYKNSKRDTHYYEDFKTRGHSSYQKSGYSGKHGGTSKVKEYDDKSNKRYESKKKFDDNKELKKTCLPGVEPRLENKEGVFELKVVKKEKERKEGLMSEEDVTEPRGRSIGKPETSSEGELNTGGPTGSEEHKDDRAERRIKNKDRPAMEIYRPGMGRFSRQRLERNKSVDEKEAG